MPTCYLHRRREPAAIRNVKAALVRQAPGPHGARECLFWPALQSLEGSGAEVTIIARTGEGWGARRVLRVDPFHIGRWWRDASFARVARRTWRREGFDLVQSHERIPGCDVYIAGGDVVGRAEKAVLEHPRLRAVICPSRKVRNEIARGFRIAPENLHVIYGGVDLEHFHPREREGRRGAARAALGCGMRDTVFLFASSSFARDGLAEAIEALAAGAADPFWLAVWGADPDREKFEQLAGSRGVSGRVRFLGAPEDSRAYYAAADCVLGPSRHERCACAVLEALAMGVPAIVSELSAAAEIVEAGVNGWLAAAQDAATLLRAMRSADRAMRNEDLARAARASAERFGLEATRRELGEIYASL